MSGGKGTAKFAEIAHSGSKFAVTTQTDAEGRRAYSFRISGSRPNAMAMYGIYALQQGIPVGVMKMGGIGDSWNAPLGPRVLMCFNADSR